MADAKQAPVEEKVEAQAPEAPAPEEAPAEEAAPEANAPAEADEVPDADKAWHDKTYGV